MEWKQPQLSQELAERAILRYDVVLRQHDRSTVDLVPLDYRTQIHLRV